MLQIWRGNIKTHSRTLSPSRSVWNRRREQYASVLTFFSVPQSDPVFKRHRLKKKNSAIKLKKKKPRGTPCLFLKIFRQIFFVNFFTFNDWNFFRGTKNNLCRRLLLIYPIYRVKTWNMKLTAHRAGVDCWQWILSVFHWFKFRVGRLGQALPLYWTEIRAGLVFSHV